MILEIVYVGHNTQGNSNKVWGILKEDTKTAYAFWGRVGKKLQFQEFPPNGYDQRIKIEEKLDKGYREINTEQLLELQPDFDQQVLALVLGDSARQKAGFVSFRTREHIKAERGGC